jgi:hypothetical protein
MFEALTLVQTKKIFPISVILVGSDFWNPLIEFLKKSPLKYGMIEESDLGLFTVVDDLKEAILITRRNLYKKIHEMEKEKHTDSDDYIKLKKICNDEACPIEEMTK